MTVIHVPEEAVAKVLPKHALTLAEVVWAYGGAESLVKELRKVGALVPAATNDRHIMFDANHVAKVWVEFRSGKYDGQLKTWKRAS